MACAPRPKLAGQGIEAASSCRVSSIVYHCSVHGPQGADLNEVASPLAIELRSSATSLAPLAGVYPSEWCAAYASYSDTRYCRLASPSLRSAEIWGQDTMAMIRHTTAAASQPQQRLL